MLQQGTCTSTAMTSTNGRTRRIGLVVVNWIIVADILCLIIYNGYHCLWWCDTKRNHRFLSTTATQQQHHYYQLPNSKRVLYIITSLDEFNKRTRYSMHRLDRLQEITIPVIVEGVSSMMDAGYSVDVYFICHYILSSERQQLIRTALDTILSTKITTKSRGKIGLTIWDDATPIGYDRSDEKSKLSKLEYRTVHLSRQHRFVIRDQLLHYDLFVNFEDDMLIKGTHLDHYIAVTNELDRLYREAPEDYYPVNETPADIYKHYYGIMTKGQLQRMIPGFMRTEVLLDETKYPAQSNTGPIPIDLYFEVVVDKRSDQQPLQQHKVVNSTICCAISRLVNNNNRPVLPISDQLMIWETNIIALGVRKMPPTSWLNWVVMQRGPTQNKIPRKNIIGDYWTNRYHQDYYYKQGPKNYQRPEPTEFKYINNQGGWMGTQQQIIQWHTTICLGGFLPPYFPPHYQYDGLDMRNVEWYSGGIQLTTQLHGCNMQRIILLDPTNFSKSLLYHTANNKQKLLSYKREESFTKANTLLGQLNTIKKRAEKDISK